MKYNLNEINEYEKALKSDRFTYRKYKQIERKFIRSNVRDLKIIELKKYYLKNMAEYAPLVNMNALDELCGRFEENISNLICEAKENDELIKSTKAINLIYYWTPPERISVSPYLCSYYESDGEQCNTDFGAGELTPFSLCGFENVRFPSDSHSRSYQVIDSTLFIMLFERLVQVVIKEKLNYMPLSVSRACGIIDGEIIPDCQLTSGSK